jgi:hypothetical protein
MLAPLLYFVFLSIVTCSLCSHCRRTLLLFLRLQIAGAGGSLLFCFLGLGEGGGGGSVGVELKLALFHRVQSTEYRVANPNILTVQLLVHVSEVELIEAIVIDWFRNATRYE